MRLSVVSTHPIQYYSPLFRRLAEIPGLFLHVIYLTDSGLEVHHDVGFDREVRWDVPLLEGFTSEFLRPGEAIQSLTGMQRHSAKLFRALEASQPDFILIFGYAVRMNWEAILYAKWKRVRVMYMSDSNYRTLKFGPKYFAKKLIVGSFFSAVDVFLCSGEANLAYLTEFGAKTNKIHRCPFSIDTERFRPPNNIQPPSIDFVWVGKLIPVKRPLDFLDALRILVAKGLQPTARMIGSGPLEELVRERGRDLIAARVLELRGFVNQSEMPAELHQARVFVFTSGGDQYGLAVTEAVAAHLPIISADVNGCVGGWTSAQPDRNALVYPSGDVRALAVAMERVLLDGSLLSRLRRQSIEIAPQQDSTIAAREIEHAMLSTIAEA